MTVPRAAAASDTWLLREPRPPAEPAPALPTLRRCPTRTGVRAVALHPAAARRNFCGDMKGTDTPGPGPETRTRSVLRGARTPRSLRPTASMGGGRLTELSHLLKVVPTHRTGIVVHTGRVDAPGRAETPAPLFPAPPAALPRSRSTGSRFYCRLTPHADFFYVCRFINVSFLFSC